MGRIMMDKMPRLWHVVGSNLNYAFIINNQLVRFGGDLSVGAYGIANGIAMVFIMFVLGVNQGMQPI